MTEGAHIVSVVHLDSYEPTAVRSALERLLAPLGSMKAFVDGKRSAVLKPNFLMPSPVETARLTHPEIIRRTAEVVFHEGVKDVVVTDSPGIGTAEKCARKLGLEIDSAFFKVMDSADSVELDSIQGDFKKIRFSTHIMEADAVINLPKLKTHAQMGMTLAVKNTFGAVMGADKAQWHFRSGRDPMEFARLIVHIHERVAPVLSILDGVIGMEGNGPSSGTPRTSGFLAASSNAHALDFAVCNILGIDPENVYTIVAAKRMGLFPDESKIEIVGDSIESLRPSPPWKLARPVKTRVIGSSLLTPILDRLLSVSPLVDKQKCTLCLRCVDCCAAQAMAKETDKGAASKSKGRIVIDEKKCIACFCCQEMCPEGAITVKTSPWARLFGLGIR
jgi:uncharacterized protein (DUF362 family)/Pyruvate/2-oxoacid:ferredoxin oxidoreductase delta subunit